MVIYDHPPLASFDVAAGRHHLRPSLGILRAGAASGTTGQAAAPGCAVNTAEGANGHQDSVELRAYVILR